MLAFMVIEKVFSETEEDEEDSSASELVKLQLHTYIHVSVWKVVVVI